MLLRIAIILLGLTGLLYSTETFSSELSLDEMVLKHEVLGDINSNQNEAHEDVMANISSFDLRVKFLGSGSQSAREMVIKAEEALSSDNIDIAETLYKKAISDAPGFQRAFMGLGKLYFIKRDYKAAVGTYITLLQMQKKLHPYTLSALILALEQYDKDKALEYSEILSKRLGKNAHIFAQHAGLILASMNRLKEAQKFFTKSISLTDKNPIYFYNLAVVFDKQDNKQAASRYYAEFLKKVDDSTLQYAESISSARQRIVLLS